MRLLSLGGLSECGKSFAGQYFASHGVLRIKIARVFAEVGQELLLDPEDPMFTDQLHSAHASTALPMFLDRVANQMVVHGVQRASLESMYRPQLAIFLKDMLGERMAHIFIEAPLELRIEREWRKLGGESREAVARRMTCHLIALCFDANDPLLLARFWVGVLGWEMADDPPDGFALLPNDDTGFRIEFFPTQEQKAGQNQLHFDLTSTSLADQQQTVARSLGLGARRIDIGQRPEEGHVVLADPEGNEFCVIEPDNNFLAGCGFIGALACDGSQEVGYFWSEALGWPLVWDQDQETAIRSPHGGPKITWGGPPLMPKTGKNRLHFDIAPPVHGDQHAEVDRLVSLGATRIDIGQGEVSWVVMADPDGHEFCVLTPR